MNGVMKEGSLGSVLHKSHIISEDDIRAALKEQERAGVRFGEALVRLGIVTQEDIDWALSHQLDIPYVRIKKEMVDLEAVALVPAAIARKYELFPLVKAGEELSIVITDPLNKEAIAAVERISGCRVALSMGLIREIREMQVAFYGEALEEEMLGFTSSAFSAAVLSAINADLTGGKLLEYLLLYGWRGGLSSLVFYPTSSGAVITGRLGGLPKQVGRLPASKYPLFVTTLKRAAGMTAADGAAMISFTSGGETCSFRVNVLPSECGELITLKPASSLPKAASLAELDLASDVRERLQAILDTPQGIAIVAASEDETRERLLALIIAELAGNGRIPLVIGTTSLPYPRIPLECNDPEPVVRRGVEQDVDVLVVADLDDPRAVRAARLAVLKGKLVVGASAEGDLPEVVRELAYCRDRGWLRPADVAGILAAADSGASSSGSVGALLVQAVAAPQLVPKLAAGEASGEVIDGLRAEGIYTLADLAGTQAAEISEAF